MKIGISELFTGSDGRDRGFVRDTAQLLEGLGFNSVWLPEHVVFFPEYRDSYPYGTQGANEVFATPGLLDPFVVGSSIAAVTERIRIGTYVCVVAQRHPIFLARDVANLDVLSGGRFEFGIGVGWSSQEFEALGVPFPHRGRRTDECLVAMKRLWSGDRLSEHHGEFYEFEPLFAYPKPVQRPHPPIVVGGNSEATIRRIVAHGDGWAGYTLTHDEIKAFIDRLAAALEAAGRSLDEITLRIGRRARALSEEAWEEDARYIEACEALGIHEVVVSPRFPVDGYERMATRYAEIVGITPAVA